MDVVAVLGVWCTVLSIGFVWPQVARVFRLNTVEGVAPLGTLHGVAATSLWCMYGIAQGLFPVILSNGVVALAMVMIASAQVRHGVLKVPVAVAGVGAVLGVGLLAWAVSPTALGICAIVVGATSIMPQSYFVLRAADLSGVSVAMYALLVLTTLSWSTYGVMVGDWLVVATNMLVLPFALLVALKAARAQRQPATLTPAPAFDPAFDPAPAPAAA